MIVEQIDAFKSWLTAVLKPMCEADPAALAKYVLALIKKDKSEEELRKSMVGQLDVFLEGETENFVNLVFQTLTTKDYINTPVIPNANPPNPNIIKTAKEVVKESKIIVQPSELPNLNETVNGTAKKEVEVKKDAVKTRRNSETEKEERPRRRSRHRSLSRNCTRSRSRSWDRLKRSRSREKSREREQHRVDREKRERPRVWRNKSPARRYERRRSRTSRSPSPIRARSRSRSPRHLLQRLRYRNRTSASRSRSRSLEKRERKDSKDPKENTSRPGTPTQDSNHGDSESRFTNSTQSLASVVVQASNKKRCRDFDEKGYCMRGEMCPFDHGVDPVVLEDAALTRVLTYNPNGTTSDATTGVLPTPMLTAPGHPMMGQRHPVQIDNPYNPQAPQIWRDGRFRGPRPIIAPRLPVMGPFAPAPNMQRELIPVPVMDNKQEGYAPSYNHQQHYMNPHDHENMYKKKPFDFNRLGPRAKNPSNCSLELKKVPQGLNSITHLNNHFSKFGKIVNIQVQYEGEPEAALITFSTHAEANAAYRSTEAVLNNRFIKVFWHNAQNQEGKQENVPPQSRSVKDRLGVNNIVTPNTNKAFNLVQPRADTAAEANNSQPSDAPDSNPSDQLAKTQLGKEESKAQATAAIMKNQELLAAHAKVKKDQDVQRKEVLKIQSDLRKRKQELLDKQLSQQKILIEKMEKLPIGPQRDVIKETIKKTQEAIQGIKKDLEQAALAIKATCKQKTKEETQKELLDAELDLITKQQEGADTTELQKKLSELRTKVGMSARGRGRGRGRYTPIVSRHLLSKNNLLDNNKLKGNIKTALHVPLSQTSFQKHTVDHRPTKLLVSGYETEEQEGVLSHFQQYGEIVDHVIDSSLPSITLNYKTRKDAEMALLKGKHFQDRTLSITWSANNNPRLQTQRSGGSSTRTVCMSESEEDHLIDQSLLEGDEELGPEISEEALLQDDEEEEEEDRSWRR